MSGESLNMILSFLGTLIGTISGIIASQKMVNLRIDNLADKVNKHNTLIDRMYKVETRVTILEDEVKK